MLNFVYQLIRKYRLADVYVMDIALVETDSKLIECNCFNGTGFYQHDIGKVVTAINNFVKEQFDCIS